MKLNQSLTRLYSTLKIGQYIFVEDDFVSAKSKTELGNLAIHLNIRLIRVITREHNAFLPTDITSFLRYATQILETEVAISTGRKG